MNQILLRIIDKGEPFNKIDNVNIYCQYWNLKSSISDYIVVDSSNYYLNEKGLDTINNFDEGVLFSNNELLVDIRLRVITLLKLEYFYTFLYFFVKKHSFLSNDYTLITFLDKMSLGILYTKEYLPKEMFIQNEKGIKCTDYEINKEELNICIQKIRSILLNNDLHFFNNFVSNFHPFGPQLGVE